ncbi:MAG: tripartite tricarboxylate transporter substrate binding protein [Betaproteobacteria bacterium]|nr:tripartite tricarboxylate transporter substrate binding protein [Betaproteobacteria bacterium]
MRKTAVLMQAFVLAVSVSITVAGGVSAQAQVSGPKGYPSKPVRLIVPYAAGGGNDVLGRNVSQKLQERMGQPWIVENRVGGGGNIGTDAVAKSAPDGYTLLLTVNTLTMSPALGEPLPYDALKDLMPVAKLVTTPLVLIAHPRVPAANLKELVAHSRANPGKLFYATPGTGTPHHFDMEWLKSITGLDATHVPYKGAPQVLTDILEGRVQFAFHALNSALPHIRAGRLRALATGGKQRLSYLKELPTIKEAGLSDFDSDIWYAIFAPAATSKEIVNFLHVEMRRVLENQDLRKTLAGLGFEIAEEISSQAFLSEMVAETNRWKKLVSDKGLKFN